MGEYDKIDSISAAIGNQATPKQVSRLQQVQKSLANQDCMHTKLTRARELLLKHPEFEEYLELAELLRYI